MLVKDAMDLKPLTIRPDASVFDLIEAILNTRHTTGAVLDAHGKLLGMVGAHDILAKIVPQYVDMDRSLMNIMHEGYFQEKFALFKATLVADFMVKEMDSVHPDDAVIKAVAIFVKKRRKTLPVIDSDGKFMGLITRRNALRIAHQFYK